ncbi:MAG: fluoride efflux transporter CrcB [Eubacterium sp.]
MSVLMVALGGAAGAVLRYLLGLIPVKEITSFPFITLIINVLGALLIGSIAAYSARHSVNESLLLFLKIGLCGGFTTFSTFSLETAQLIKSGSIFEAIIYAVLSAVLCICAVFAAEFVTARIF